MRTIEKAATIAWLRHAADTRYGVCHKCRRAYDDHGGHLLVARQPKARRYLCLECWDQQR